MTPHPKIMERIREDLTGRGVMDKIDEVLKDRLEYQISLLDSYKTMRTVCIDL